MSDFYFQSGQKCQAVNDAREALWDAYDSGVPQRIARAEKWLDTVESAPELGGTADEALWDEARFRRLGMVEY